MPDNNQNPNPNPSNPQYYPNPNAGGGYSPAFAPGGNPTPNNNYYATGAAPINPQYDYGNPNYGQPNPNQSLGQNPPDSTNPYAYPDNLNYNSSNPDPNQQAGLTYDQQPNYDPNNPYTYPEYTTPDYSAANNNPAPDYNTNYDANYTQDYTQNPPGQDQNLDPNNPNNNYQDYTAAPNPDQNPGNGSQGDNQNPQNPGEGKNTFEEKKSGNRLFFIISGIVIVLLLVATGFLSWYSLSGRQAQDATNSDSSQSVNENFSEATSSQTPSQQISSSPTSLSGSSQPAQISQPAQTFSSAATFSQAISADFTNPSGPTPAEIAKVNNATTLASDWIVQKFTGSDLSPDGTCRNTLRCGGSADPDRDGLVNTEEYNYQTDPLNSDTDTDGFADGDETNAYATNPNARDSDGDGFADGDEILACQNPALKNGQVKMDQNKLSQIKSALQLEPLQETTIATFNKFGAAAADISTGYLQSSCGEAPGTGTGQQEQGNVVF